MTELRKLWALDEGLVFLNHGSFGAVPHEMLERAAGLRRELERNPIAGMWRDDVGDAPWAFFELVRRTDTSGTFAAPRKVLQPPEWLSWCMISIGAVLCLHSLAMPKPG